jgi:hypothetical protein
VARGVGAGGEARPAILTSLCKVEPKATSQSPNKMLSNAHQNEKKCEVALPVNHLKKNAQMNGLLLYQLSKRTRPGLLEVVQGDGEKGAPLSFDSEDPVGAHFSQEMKGVPLKDFFKSRALGRG